MKKKIISVDFDGVVIEKLFGKDFAQQGEKSSPRWWSPMIYFLDKWWTGTNQNWRRPVAGSKEGLKKIGEKFEVVMLTSRKSYLRESTMRWLKKWGYFGLYSKYYFNNTYIGAAESKVENARRIGPMVHIDDNWPTVKLMARECPKTKLILLGEKRKTKNRWIKFAKNWEEVGKLIEKLG